LNLQHQSIFQRARFSIQLQLLRQQQTVAHMRLGRSSPAIGYNTTTELIAFYSYQNGSILIANLLPQFTILHTLTTSRGPSPILSIAWHASSSKQKSDMLATQASDGDLRVWSVAKPPGKESPRVIRVLKRSDSTSSDPKWMAWSKNGRIVQYLDG
jgi:hypothetical protein